MPEGVVSPCRAWASSMSGARSGLVSGLFGLSGLLLSGWLLSGSRCGGDHGLGSWGASGRPGVCGASGRPEV
ncbi:hypothetical protein AB0A74_42655 [Saccharothrix sp. NPDC042600]|uniref:hypothetical protein n=1 Tax=Saccharothrix sp. NPDC042600 TaxID=3154492 RepID=UPI0033E75272